MKRTKQSYNPTCLLTGDWHLREDTPICRTDNYWEAQWRKVKFISELQQKYQCPVYHSGDLFDYWKPSPHLISACLRSLPEQFITVYGNHDLPQNSYESRFRSGVFTLAMAGVIELLITGHWNCDLPLGSFEIEPDRIFGMQHIMTWKSEKPWPGCIDPNAEELLDAYPEIDLMLVGHNHKTFIEQVEDRLLVNPGSLMRMAADQEDHEPCVFLWYAKSNTVEKVTLPYEEGVISREHIEKKEQKDERIQAFVQKLNTDWTTEVSFESNLEQFFKTNRISKTVENIIWKSIDKEI